VRVVEVVERAPLERFLRRAAPAHLYALADLDLPFWPDTRWYATRNGDGEIDALCLVFEKLAPPIVYAVAPPHDAGTLALVSELLPRLPDRFFANLPLGGCTALARTHAVEPHGEHLKLWLPDAAKLGVPTLPGVAPLGPGDADELARFYAERAYRDDERGGRFFAPYMLELFPWLGLRERGELVCVAGLHVFSRAQGVAALGNVATVPERRGRGLARSLCAQLARDLLEIVPLVGLNVAASNEAALRCYRGLGFREALRYEEGVITRGPGGLW
jgi:RimJ/RimL family protein N-acetyltransferase